MSLLRRRDIQRSLSQKGFKAEGDIWYFWHKGQRTDIRVLISSGQKYREYGDPALKTKVKLLKLQSLKEVKDLFKCPMDMDGFIEKIRSRGIQL